MMTLDVIAGQGTIGLEILGSLNDVDMIIVPVGGGGLISGIASVVKALKPKTKTYRGSVRSLSLRV